MLLSLTVSRSIAVQFFIYLRVELLSLMADYRVNNTNNNNNNNNNKYRNSETIEVKKHILQLFGRHPKAAFFYKQINE
jgi:hypothetical protein